MEAGVIEVYADGSSSGRAGAPIGWGWVVVRDGNVLYASYGGGPDGTNNIAELMAAIDGLSYVVSKELRRGQEEVVLISDSLYVLGMCSGKYSPKANGQICGELRTLGIKLAVTTRWVRGHSINPRIPWEDNHMDSLLNQKCDQLARHGRDEASKTPVRDDMDSTETPPQDK
jgi:ribonuclease HI